MYVYPRTYGIMFVSTARVCIHKFNQHHCENHWDCARTLYGCGACESTVQEHKPYDISTILSRCRAIVFSVLFGGLAIVMPQLVSYCAWPLRGVVVNGHGNRCVSNRATGCNSAMQKTPLMVYNSVEKMYSWILFFLFWILSLNHEKWVIYSFVCPRNQCKFNQRHTMIDIEWWCARRVYMTTLVVWAITITNQSYVPQFRIRQPFVYFKL